jgi:hypothetical protein
MSKSEHEQRERERVREKRGDKVLFYLLIGKIKEAD